MNEFVVSHLWGSPACGGVCRWLLSPACWASLRTVTVLPASTLGSDTVCGRRVRLVPSTITLPSPGWTEDSGDNHPLSSELRGCPQAGGPARGPGAGSASPLGGTEWCDTPPGWRWSPPSPECPVNIWTHAGGNLRAGRRDTDTGH